MASNEENNEENNEDDIENETKAIFECYVESCLEQDRDNHVIDPGTPGLPKDELPSVDRTKCWAIGKALVSLSEEINLDDGDPVLRQILRMININGGSKGAFQDFSDVAERVLSNRVSWRAIVYLFRFGYYIARDRLVQGAREFLQQLYQWIIDVFKRFSVFNWIIEQGGWLALPSNFASYRPHLMVGGAVAILTLFVILYMRQRNAQ